MALAAALVLLAEPTGLVRPVKAALPQDVDLPNGPGLARTSAGGQPMLRYREGALLSTFSSAPRAQMRKIFVQTPPTWRVSVGLVVGLGLTTLAVYGFASHGRRAMKASNGSLADGSKTMFGSFRSRG